MDYLGRPEETGSGTTGVLGDTPVAGSGTTTSDVTVSYTVNDATWVTGIDYDGVSNRPYKIARTAFGAGDAISIDGVTKNLTFSGDAYLGSTAPRVLQSDVNGNISLGLMSNTHSTGTGVITGGVLSVNANPNLLDISDGTGVVTDPTTGVDTEVSWTGLTAQVHGGVGLLSYVSLSSLGVPIYSATVPTRAWTRDNIFLGVIAHPGGNPLTGINNEHCVSINPPNQIRDIMTVLGNINNSGNLLSGNANLTFLKSAGTMFSPGGNWGVDVKDPHVKTLDAIDTSGAGRFQYTMRDGTNSATTSTLTDIIPNKLDDGSPYPGISYSNANNFGVNYVYSFLSNNLRIGPPQDDFKTEEAAVESIGNGNRVVYPPLLNGMLIGYIITKGTCTDLTDPTTAHFLAAAKFGNSVSQVVGGTQNLQSVYDNSVAGSIVTDATRLAVKFKNDPGGNDANKVFEVHSLGGIDTMSVRGSGLIVTTGGLTATAGDITAQVGSINANNSMSTITGSMNSATTITAGTGITATTGNITATAGDLVGQTLIAEDWLPTSATNNVMIGAGAGTDLSGVNNVAIGAGTLSGIGTGNSNIGIGTNAGNKITNAAGNIAIGQNALLTNLTGGSNIAIGKFSLNDHTGGTCVAVGENSLNNTTGANNTGFGNGCGTINVLGTNNVFIGNASNSTTSSHVNQTALGASAVCDTSNQCTIGGSGITCIRSGSDEKCDLGQDLQTLKDIYLSGSIMYKGYQTTANSTYTVDVTDYHVRTTSTGLIDIELPTLAAVNNGRTFRFTKGAVGNPTTINGFGADLIGTSNTYTQANTLFNTVEILKMTDRWLVTSEINV